MKVETGPEVDFPLLARELVIAEVYRLAMGTGNSRFHLKTSAGLVNLHTGHLWSPDSLHRFKHEPQAKLVL